MTGTVASAWWTWTAATLLLATTTAILLASVLPSIEAGVGCFAVALAWTGATPVALRWIGRRLRLKRG